VRIRKTRSQEPKPTKRDKRKTKETRKGKGEQPEAAGERRRKWPKLGEDEPEDKNPNPPTLQQRLLERWQQRRGLKKDREQQNEQSMKEEEAPKTRRVALQKEAEGEPEQGAKAEVSLFMELRARGQKEAEEKLALGRRPTTARRKGSGN
jgi:hypothetical protein